MSSGADGPFKILERINDNEDRVKLPEEYRISTTFNVADLSPYLDHVPLEDLRSNLLQQGEANGDPSNDTNPNQNAKALIL